METVDTCAAPTSLLHIGYRNLWARYVRYAELYTVEETQENQPKAAYVFGNE